MTTTIQGDHEAPCRTVTRRRRIGLLLTALLALLARPLPAEIAPSPRDRLVVIVCVDGLRRDAWARARTPHLDRLAREGAFTERALSCAIPMTLPAHASMVTGLPPREHGLLSGRRRPGRTVQASTVFAWARAAGLQTSVVVSKAKLTALNVPGAVQHFALRRPQVVVGHTARFLEGGRRGLVFLHFADVDACGHRHGWMSPAQIRTVEIVDSRIGRLVGRIEAAGLHSHTTLLVVSDHGGHGRDHGMDCPEDLEVPFILWGRGIRAGAPLGENVTILDVAPTAAALLGVPPPAGLSGRILRQALDGSLRPPSERAALQARDGAAPRWAPPPPGGSIPTHHGE